MVVVEPFAHFRKFGQEEKVEEIDVKGTGADVLETPSDACLLGKECLMIAEVHDHNEHEGVHGHGLGQVGPLMFDKVPPENVCTAEEGKQHRDEEESFGVEESLDAWPIAVGNVAEEEEVHELQGLVEGAVHHEIGLPPFAECLRHEEGDMGAEADDPENDDSHIFRSFAKALEEGCHYVVNEEHLKEHPCEPISEFGGCFHGAHKTLIKRIMGTQYNENTKEDKGGEHLHFDFLPSEGSKALRCPKPFCLICQKSADEEEEGHAEEHEKGEGGGDLLRLHESRLCHMVGDDEYHGESTHGIEPFKSLGLSFFHGVIV